MSQLSALGQSPKSCDFQCMQLTNEGFFGSMGSSCTGIIKNRSDLSFNSGLLQFTLLLKMLLH